MSSEIILGITGHRNLGGWNLPNPVYNYVCQNIEKQFVLLQPSKIITGMAVGVDSWAAHIANKLSIPYIAAIPFKTQEKLWPESSQRTYHKLLAKAESVILVSEGEYSAAKLQIRNQFIVDNCTTLLAVWNQIPKGGTFNCITYAKKVRREIIYIDSNLV